MGSVGDSRYNADAPPRLTDYAKEVKAKIDANYTKNFDGQKIRRRTCLSSHRMFLDKPSIPLLLNFANKIGAENVGLNDKVFRAFYWH